MFKPIPKYLEHENAPESDFRLTTSCFHLWTITYFLSSEGGQPPHGMLCFSDQSSCFFDGCKCEPIHFTKHPPVWCRWATNLQLQEITLRHRGVLRAVRPWQAHGVVRNGDVATEKNNELPTHIYVFSICHAKKYSFQIDLWWIPQIYILWDFMISNLNSSTAAV